MELFPHQLELAFLSLWPLCIPFILPLLWNWKSSVTPKNKLKLLRWECVCITKFFSVTITAAFFCKIQLCTVTANFFKTTKIKTTWMAEQSVCPPSLECMKSTDFTPRRWCGLILGGQMTWIHAQTFCSWHPEVTTESHLQNPFCFLFQGWVLQYSLGKNKNRWH